MCRLVGWVSREPRTLRSLLGDDVVERLLYLSTVHCHGWGIAWHSESGLQVRRSRAQASSDPDFLAVLDDVASTAALVHLRLGTPGFDRELADTHPFRDGDWALAHNGAIAPSDRVSALLPDSGPQPHGTTDSERWFLALRAAHADSDTPEPERTAGAAAAVMARAAAADLTCSSWNSLLLGPDALYVVNDHDDAWQPTTIPVWPDVPPDATLRWPPYFDLRLRQDDDARVVVSSGVVDLTDGWTLLPNNSIVRLGTDGRAAQIVPIPSVSAVSR